MTEQATTCKGASLLNGDSWHSINWRQCYREVRRLQARIVKATREGKHGKVNVTNGAIVIHTQRLKSDPGGNLLS